MLERLESLYDATLRPLGPLHRVLKALAWTGGDLLVAAVSRFVRYRLPDDGIFPFYELQMLLGTYEATTVRAARALVRPGMTVFDVGAHAGYFTLLFSRMVGPRGRVYAFEPHPDSFEVLRRNTASYGLHNVTLVPRAVSDREGSVTLWQTPLSMGHSLHPIKAHVQPRPVEVISLDGFARQHGIDTVDLVKMDVEGAEPEVLDGMRELAARSRALALILEFKSELCQRRGLEPRAWLDRLAAFGFATVDALHDGAPTRTVAAADPFALNGIRKCNLVASRTQGPQPPR